MLDKIEQDLKIAMVNHDIAKVSVLRMLKGELQNKAIENKGSLSDQDITAVLKKSVKQRKDAAKMYQDAGEDVRAEAELAESEILLEYLPEQMSDDELKLIVNDKAMALQTQNVGQLIGAVMQEVGDKADGGRVAKFVQERLKQ